MTDRHVTRTLATAALLLAAVSACADESPTPSPTASSTPTPSSSLTTSPTTPTASDPTGSPSPSTDSERASEAAASLIRQYFAVVDQARQDPTVPASRLKSVAAGTELSAQEIFLEKQRKQRRRQIGGLRIESMSVKSVNLSAHPTVQVHVCWDVSGVDVVDAHGKSVVNESRKPVGWTSLMVTNSRFATDPVGGWRVSGSSDLEEPPCAVS